MKRGTAGLMVVAACVAVLLAMSGAALRAPDVRASADSAPDEGHGVIRGNVLDYTGLPPASSYVMWLTEDNSPRGGAFTDATGSYSDHLRPSPQRQRPALAVHEGTTTRSTCAQDSPSSWPDHVRLLARAPPAQSSTRRTVDREVPVVVELFGSAAASPVLSTDQRLRVGSADTFTGYAYGLPGDYAGAVVTFRGGGWPARRTEAQEIEMPQGAPAVVQSGQTGAVSLLADERDAARAEVTRWASGAPGTMVTLRLSNLRGGDVYKITGESMNGREPVKTFATVTVPSPHPPRCPCECACPSAFPIGDKYNFEATRIGSHLDLVASYQVCAFSASRHSIARGESVKLRGRVPMIPNDVGRAR